MLEIWKSIEGYEGKYEVSNLGRVKSLQDNKGRKREQIVVVNIANNGYLYVNLWKTSRAKSKRIHRLVADAFCERHEGDECVNHKNGVKTDNRAENLEWCTYSYNTKHSYEKGLRKPTRGEKDGMYGVHGKDHPSSKPVLQFTLDGEFLREWENAIEAGKALNIRGASIQRCARGDRKTAFGYKWEYKKAGQKPVEKVMIADVDQSVIDEVERMVQRDE